MNIMSNKIYAKAGIIASRGKVIIRLRQNTLSRDCGELNWFYFLLGRVEEYSEKERWI